MTDKTATLGVEGTNHQFMLLEGSVGPEVIDIRKLYGETGLFTYDPGFTSTASCKSAITYIDGEAGILLVAYRPAPSADVADRLYGIVRGNAANETNELMWGSPGTMLAPSPGIMRRLGG